ncbi:MAG: hypothetical protein IPM54_06775 [Polyangiaceae bacterium]|nr:hypothetical protein [Polyangiaceae bacterium]
MQSLKHWLALGLLGAFGVIIVTSSKQPAARVNASAPPPIERQHTARVAAYVTAASDVCMRLNAPDPNAMDAVSLKALRDACTRAAEDQARELDWGAGEWVVEEPAGDTAAPARRPPRVAKRAAPGAVEEVSTGRNR